ncbi:MAG: hypothetical protein KJ062_03525 [Thermoanaerobaculia bacterium]|nr:hypothetical protein [Thermoanaerobaculia bacterium]
MRTKFTILTLLLALVAVGTTAEASGGDSLYEFFGTVEAMPASGFVGTWTVAGKAVHVSAQTEIEQLLGPAKVGATVRVRGTLRADGSVDAKNVEVKTGDDGAGTPARFTAVVSSMPASGYVGTWVVGGRTVHVSASTRVVETNGIPKVGSTVEVQGSERADGSVDAEEIEVRGGAGGGGTEPGEDLHVFGLIESLPSGSPPLGDWTVSGRTIRVTTSTLLNAEGGVFAVGAYVEAEGTSNPDGSLAAVKVELRRAVPPAGAAPTSFRGAVEVLASTPGWIGDWRVTGRTVAVTGTTLIDQERGTVALGALVEVHGTSRADGTVLADRIEVEWGPASSGAQLANTWILPSSARKRGRDDAFYTTNVTISNTGAAAAQVTLRFLGHERDGRTGPEKSFSLAAGATVTFTDVLSSAFGLADDYGAILVSANVATLVVESATSTPGGGGEFGQGLGASGRNDLIGDDHARSLVGVRDDARARTNLVLTNAVEKAIDVDLNLFREDGAVLGSLRVRLEPLGMRQVNGVSRAVGAAGDAAGARLVLSTPTPGGAFAAYASVIDNGTDDPRILSPR